METFINYTPIVIGIWVVALALIMSTDDIKSAMVFKVIPFFLGMSSLFAGGKLIGLI